MRVEKIGAATLYLGDCFEVFPEVGRLSSVVTDPPYGINFAAQPTKWQRRAGATAEPWDSSTANDLPKLLAQGERQVVWGGNYYGLPPSRGWLAWFKPDAPPSMASIELAWTSVDQNARQFTYSIGQANAERVGHPTQKPLAVMAWTLSRLPDGGGLTVGDPFMGSGTTGVAAVRAGKQFFGVEISEKYFDMACRRIEQVQRQADMFV